MLEMGHAKVYLCTEFEVSSFTRSKFMEGVLKNLARTLTTPYFGTFCHSSMRWDMPRAIRNPKKSCGKVSWMSVFATFEKVWREKETLRGL